MAEDEWLRMDLPPLLLTRLDLRELAEAAGEEAYLELPEKGRLSSDEMEAASPDSLVGVTLKAPGFSISFSANASGTELAYEDQDEKIERAELVLKRLESCRRVASILTHTDAAIIAGMALPVAAGLLAPASHTLLACGIAAGLWMLYLWRVQHNAHHKWCVFR